ncbi:hypothetical protein K438DRAFT_2008668 [Mycena galopus ATCC 62051]|nr:hypothetical protein K438DRAFT_2008668 [Mycena galopus ATCC 62051]
MRAGVSRAHVPPETRQTESSGRWDWIGYRAWVQTQESVPRFLSFSCLVRTMVCSRAGVHLEEAAAARYMWMDPAPRPSLTRLRWRFSRTPSVGRLFAPGGRAGAGRGAFRWIRIRSQSRIPARMLTRLRWGWGRGSYVSVRTRGVPLTSTSSSFMRLRLFVSCDFCLFFLPLLSFFAFVFFVLFVPSPCVSIRMC